MSAGMIALDIGFSVVEVIMLCYITHFFLKRKTKRSTDLAVLLIYVLIIEIQTFISVNLPIKVTISMVLWAVVCSIFYRTKLITGIITYAIVTNCVGASEMLMIVFSIGIGNTNMINEWYAYIFNHIISFSMLILIGKILMKIRDDLSWKEEILVAAVMVACLISEAATMSYKDAIGLTFAIWQLIAMILLLFGFFVLWAYLRNSIQIRLQSQNEKQQIQKLQAQYQFYKEKQKEEERVRAIYHDMKNHLLVLQAEPANSPGSQEMIGSLQKQISSYETYYQTNNAFLDIILRDKMQTANECKIDFHAEIDFSEGDFIDGLDISTIFGNALDNAIEACEKLAEDERFITVKAGIKNQFLLIQVDNSAEENNETDHTAKEDGFLHGFGKKNIQRAVEKYYGHCMWSFEQGVYSLSILIPLPQ